MKYIKDFMMKYIKFIIIALTIASTALTLHAGDNADAVYQDIQHEYILDNNGEVTYNYSHKLELKTGFAVNRAYGESFVVYNPEWQELKINKSETTMRNGDKVQSTPNAFNEVLPRAAYDAVPYLGLRETVITHLGLEQGAVIDFSYTIKTKKGYFPGLIGSAEFFSHSPIEKMTVTVKIPKSQNLIFNGPAVSKESADGEYKVYTWNMSDIPLVPVETNQPAMYKFNPVLFFTTADAEKQSAHFLSGKDLLKITPAMKEKIAELTKNDLDDIQKANTLAKYISENIGLAHIPLDWTAYKTQNAAATWQNNVGTYFDKAVLLKSCLTALNIESSLLMGGNSAADNFFLNNFSHAYVIPKFEFCDKMMILDPASYREQPVNHDLYTYGTLQLTDGKSIKLPTIQSHAKAIFDMELSCDMKLTGIANISLSGFYLAAGMTTDADKKLQFLLPAGYKIKSSEQLPAYMQNSANHKITFEESTLTAAAPDAKLYSLELPILLTPLMKHKIALYDRKRKTPIFLDHEINETSILRLKLPKNAEISELKDVAVKNSLGKASISFSTKDNTLTATYMLTISKTEITPELYPELRALLTPIYNSKNRTIWTEKK